MRPRWGRWSKATVAVVALGAVGGCGGGSDGDKTQPDPSGHRGGTLTVVQAAAAPLTLDPAKTGATWVNQLAYEPLIIQRGDGSFAPGLATSWEYKGSDNRTFVVHLRKGVKFSDGSELTAKVVVDNLRYVVKANGPYAQYLAGDTFTATDPLTVTIRASRPTPDFPLMLTQAFNVGAEISGKALKTPARLGARTFGAGPYTLDRAHTTTGDHYTYVPNPHYYDPRKIHWQRVVVKVLGNAQSVLNALNTGQADVALGDPSTEASAKQAGLTVASAPSLWVGAVLADRNGTIAKPLADVRVRQALNYATDREAIAKALFADTGKPTTQPTVPGGYGYDESLNGLYPYDVAKGRRLLAEAGYASGFELEIVTTEYGQQNLVAQAMAQQWAKIGVKLKVTDDANSNQYGAAAFGGKVPTFTTAFGELPIWIEGPILFLKTAVFNPFHVVDKQLQSLYDQAAAASGSDQQRLDQQVVGRMVREAWFVPVVSTGLPFYARKSVTGIETSPKAANLSLYDVQPAA